MKKNKVKAVWQGWCFAMGQRRLIAPYFSVEKTGEELWETAYKNNCKSDETFKKFKESMKEIGWRVVRVTIKED